MKGHLHKKYFRTNNFGKSSVTESAIDLWNKIQDQMGEIALKDLRPSKTKWLLIDNFIKSYLLFSLNSVHYHYHYIFLNHTIASRKIYTLLLLYIHIYIYLHFFR